jgi:sigma-E factor negative regulatory protein RseB
VWGLLACSALAPFVPLSATAQAVAGAPDAVDWIARLNTAATRGIYSGTMVFTAGSGMVSSSRVAHVCHGDQIYERVEALDGHQHRVYRYNETVHSVWPHKKIVVVEQQAASPSLVSTRRRVEPRALAHYTLSLEGMSVVAGRSAQVLLLTPKDEFRFAQRLLADEATGLLLRADVIDPTGRVLESSGFSDVSIGGKGDVQAVLQGMTPAGYKVLPSVRRSVDWRAQGWQLKTELPGFELIGSVQRPPPGGSGGQPALQAMFSDGLSFVSLFIEPWHEPSHRQALATEMGATHTLMQRVGDHWITAMGDVPRQTLEHFVNALEHRR